MPSSYVRALRSDVLLATPSLADVILFLSIPSCRPNRPHLRYTISPEPILTLTLCFLLLLCSQNHPSPKTSHSTLQARLTSASKLNDSLADVFKERAAIEQTYVAALQKLQSKRGAGGGVGGAGGRGEMGGLGAVWERVWGEVNEVSTSVSPAPARPLGTEACTVGWARQEGRA